MENLANIFSDNKSVGIAYFFGSRARGKARKSSDYDFAVFLTDRSPIKRHATLFRLAGELSSRLGTDAVDVVSLNDLSSPLLKHEIIRGGRVLFERGSHRMLFEPRALHEYLDFKMGMRRNGWGKAA